MMEMITGMNKEGSSSSSDDFCLQEGGVFRRGEKEGGDRCIAIHAGYVKNEHAID